MSETEMLYLAIERDDWTSLQRLLGQEPNLLDAAIDTKGTPLHCAAMMGKRDMVDYLIRCGAEVDSLELERHSTPLGLASFNCHPHVCELLIVSGANPNYRDANGLTPLDYAVVGSRGGWDEHWKSFGLYKSKITYRHIASFLMKAGAADTAAMTHQQIYGAQGYDPA